MFAYIALLESFSIYSSILHCRETFKFVETIIAYWQSSILFSYKYKNLSILFDGKVVRAIKGMFHRAYVFFLCVFQNFSRSLIRKNFLIFLQKPLWTYKGRPAYLMTGADIGDSPFLIRVTDQGCAGWHYILVPAEKVAALRAQMSCGAIDLTQFGRVIINFDDRSEIKQLSGWGEDPPARIQAWVENNYGQ